VKKFKSTLTNGQYALRRNKDRRNNVRRNSIIYISAKYCFGNVTIGNISFRRCRYRWCGCRRYSFAIIFRPVAFTDIIEPDRHISRQYFRYIYGNIWYIFKNETQGTIAESKIVRLNIADNYAAKKIRRSSFRRTSYRWSLFRSYSFRRSSFSIIFISAWVSAMSLFGDLFFGDEPYNLTNRYGKNDN